MTDAAAKITREPPVLAPLSERLHIPVARVAWRGVCVESPIPLDTLLRYRVQHPGLVSPHYNNWFRTLAAGGERHTKQLREGIKVHKIL